VNGAEAATCCFCDTRLSQNTGEKSAPPPARPQATQTEGNLAIAPDWRSEVASRLEAYRARRKRLGSDSGPAQPELLFDDDPHETPQPDSPLQVDVPPAPAARSRQQGSSSPEPLNRAGEIDRGDRANQIDQAERRNRANQIDRGNRAPQIDQAERANRATQIDRANQVERGNRANQIDPGNRAGERDRVDIDVAQPALDFGVGAPASHPRWKTNDWKTNDRKTAARNPTSPWAESQLFPVASLAERRRAALLDVALLLFSYGAFLSLFAALGGRFAFSKLDVAVVAATLTLFYALYVALFTFFGGSTPGMMLGHLRVVSFDGSDPTPSQLLWRSFGYLVSAGTLLFGFLAALWDEDHLTWHDRISQTYLTSDEETSSSATSAQPPREDYRHRA
jgi:uncharacterized RDD family membrane protein YckC